MISWLDTTSRRISVAVGLSILLHGLVLWGSHLELPHFKSSLPPLTAKLEKLPDDKVKPKSIRKAAAKQKREVPPKEEPVAQQPIPEPTAAELLALAQSAVVAASTPAATETSAPEDDATARPPLPHRAQLTFAVNKGTGTFKIGEVIHTLEIDDGHYVLRSVTETVGLAKVFKTYKLTQYSSGSYSEQGLKPERFFEERAEKSGTQRNTVDFDNTTQRATFSHGAEVPLPPHTQDILSVLYQFPPLTQTALATVSVSNGKKIERYEFEIAANETIHTGLGELSTVHLRKQHQPNEEGLEIWLASEYRLFPVKMRIIEKSGEISGEIVITDIRAEFEEEETRKDAVN